LLIKIKIKIYLYLYLIFFLNFIKCDLIRNLISTYPQCFEPKSKMEGVRKEKKELSSCEIESHHLIHHSLTPITLFLLLLGLALYFPLQPPHPSSWSLLYPILLLLSSLFLHFLSTPTPLFLFLSLIFLFLPFPFFPFKCPQNSYCTSQWNSLHSVSLSD